ncbi:MAG: hypothetical protein IJO52_02410 [Clostridia bacterium]|nr:hypothetical protein [Clostridia bacterium]
MTKSKLPKWLIALLCAGIIVCSIFPGVFAVPAIIMFSVLCVSCKPPLLILIPLISLEASFLIGYSVDLPTAITFAVNSLSYVLPSVMIAISYFHGYSKFLTVMNAAFGIFIYNIPIVITHFFLNHGAFTKELLNAAIDGVIGDMTQEMLAQISAFEQGGEALISYIQAMEQAMYLSKPILPAIFIVFSFISAYIAVCSSNGILKALKIIEKKRYVLMPPWQLGIVFFACAFVNTFAKSFSFFFVITTSVQIILIPIYVIVAYSLAYGAILKATNNRTVSVIILICAIFVTFSPIIYNLLYLIGCSYSIINGIKSKHNNSKGGTL